MKTGLLFDLDGTLLDTLEDLLDATNFALRAHGFPERSLEQLRKVVGNGAANQIRKSLPEGTPEDTVQQVLATYKPYYTDHCQIKTRPYEGIREVLALLKEKYPDMTKDDFAEILKMSSEDLGESGYDTTYGWGFLRVPQAIAAADVYFGNADPSHLNGVVRNDLGWWLMKDGLVDLHANGIYQNPFGWWKASDGKITFDETGIFQNENGWWRVENSKVDFRANGIYQNPYGWWKTTNGKVTFHENGVFQNAFGWWYCRNSKVDFGFTGLASNKYGTWYIRNGKVDFTKNGKVKYNGKTYVVQNGKVK